MPMQNVLLSLVRLDLILETLSGLIALMVSHYADKAFRVTSQRRLSDLSTGFLVLSAGMFGRVLGTLYFFVLAAEGGPSSQEAQTLMGVVIVAYGVMRVMAYLVFVVATRHSRRDVPAQAMLALALPILISPSLEIIAILVLVVIVLQNLMNYLAVRTRYALYVLIGFVLLLLSHVFGIFSLADLRGYALSQVAQFLGFSSFLILLRKASGDE